MHYINLRSTYLFIFYLFIYLLAYLHLSIVEFRMVAHVPVLSRSDQPTFAIVSLLYCEKLAVDAMIDYKTTYIRCKKGSGLDTEYFTLYVKNVV